MSYELWSLTSRNLMHSFETKDEAVETVRLYLEDGALKSSELAIVTYDDDDVDVPSGSLTGSELVAFADGHRSDHGRRTA
jgi:hypothetical protein